jgi:hypothetical protein
MTGSSKVVNIHGHKKYPVRPKIPQQHYHGKKKGKVIPLHAMEAHEVRGGIALAHS